MYAGFLLKAAYGLSLVRAKWHNAAMAERTRGFAQRVDIAADAARVWRAMTVSSELERWCSPGAAMQPKPGGLFRATVDRVAELEAHIDIFEPGRRLRLIYLPSPSFPPSDVALVADFLFVRNRDMTVVRLLGSGVPSSRDWDTPLLRLRTGWERALARLKVFVEKDSEGEGAAP